MTKIIKRNKICMILSSTILITMLVLVSSINVQQVNALGKGNETCWETGTCKLFTDPVNTMLKPLVDVFTINNINFFYVIIWAVILGIIWIRTHHIMLTGVVGTLIAAMYTADGFNAVDPRILLIGYLLLAVSIGIVVFQLIVVRLNYPQN